MENDLGRHSGPGRLLAAALTALAKVEPRLQPVPLLGRLLAGVSLGGIALWWAMRGVELQPLGRALLGASSFWVMLALLGVVAVVLVKAMRWRVLYGPVQPSFWQLLAALAAAQMVNLLIPIRLGELLRIAFIKRAGQPGVVTLTTIIVEKSLDLVTTGLVAVALLVLSVAPPWLQQPLEGLALTGLALLGGLALLWLLRERLDRRLTPGPAQANGRLGRWQQYFLVTGHTMFQTFETSAKSSKLGWVLFWSLAGWSLSLLTIMALLAAFRLDLPLTAALTLMLAVNSSNILPSPPALLGLMQLIAVIVLGYYGVPRSSALGFGIILNLVTVVPLVVLGSWALLLWVTPSLKLYRPNP